MIYFLPESLVPSEAEALRALGISDVSDYIIASLQIHESTIFPAFRYYSSGPGIKLSCTNHKNKYDVWGVRKADIYCASRKCTARSAHVANFDLKLHIR